jgi:phage terminase large subunit GpA-like protein
MATAAPPCPSCGEELILEMDPASPEDADAVVLSADPPYRYVCASPRCQS